MKIGVYVEKYPTRKEWSGSVWKAFCYFITLPLLGLMALGLILIGLLMLLVVLLQMFVFTMFLFGGLPSYWEVLRAEHSTIIAVFGILTTIVVGILGYYFTFKLTIAGAKKLWKKFIS